MPIPLPVPPKEEFGEKVLKLVAGFIGEVVYEPTPDTFKKKLSEIGYTLNKVKELATPMTAFVKQYGGIGFNINSFELKNTINEVAKKAWDRVKP